MDETPKAKKRIVDTWEKKILPRNFIQLPIIFFFAITI